MNTPRWATQYAKGIHGRTMADADGCSPLSRSVDDALARGRAVIVSTFRWQPIVVAYCLYALMTLAGFVVGINLQVAGAVIFLGFMAFQYGRFIFPLHMSWLMLLLLLSVILPIISPLAGAAQYDDATVSYFVKYYAIYLLLIVCVSLRMAPIFRSKYRWWVFGTILGIQLIGLAYARTFQTNNMDRLEGIFANPNNFALAAISLLFFLDEKRDSVRMRLAFFGIVAVFILLSGTAGAMVGYAVGVLYWTFQKVFARVLLLAFLCLTLLTVVVFVGVSYYARSGNHFSGPVGSLLLKVKTVEENVQYLQNDSDLNFGEIEKQEGERGSASALWRLLHWQATMQTFVRGNWVSIVFGNGIGSSRELTGRLPHNDYLRILFEMGIVGFLCNIGVWALLFYQLQPAQKCIFLMIAVYCFTENNIDNFLVMSIFILFVASARLVKYLPSRRKEPALGV